MVQVLERNLNNANNNNRFYQVQETEIEIANASVCCRQRQRWYANKDKGETKGVKP